MVAYSREALTSYEEYWVIGNPILAVAVDEEPQRRRPQPGGRTRLSAPGLACRREGLLRVPFNGIELGTVSHIAILADDEWLVA